MDREKRLFTGQMIEGDFEENTMKFKIDGEMILQAGNYTIMLTDDFKKLSEPITEADTSGKANELITDVSKRLFTLREAQEMYFAGHINPFTENELLEKDKNGMSVKFLETVKRCYF